MANILEEYLVKLGVNVDSGALNKIKKFMGDLDKTLNSRIAPFASAFLTVNAAIIKVIDSTAKADMQYQLLAQRMFISVKAAKAFTIATEALGHNLQEIAWNAELREKYFILVDQINKLEVPQEAKDMFKQVRDIGFQFTRLKAHSKNALEWLTFHLLKTNREGVSGLYEKMESWTNYVIKTIPIWTKKLADFLQVPLQLLDSAIDMLGKLKDFAIPVFEVLWGFLTKIWGMMPGWGKELAILGGLLLAAFLPVTGPVLAASAAISALFLLIDDFYTYLEGGDSSTLLKPLWEVVDFLNFTLAKGFLRIIVIADHFWTALKGDKHISGLSWKEDLAKTTEDFEKDYFAKKAARGKGPVGGAEGLGSVSEKFESGGRGAGTVSSGKGDKGGVSYGTYQFASEGGANSSVAKFVKSSGYEKDFAGLIPGSKEFSNKWREMAAKDPEFGKKQQEYIGKTHYNPQMAKLSEAGIDISKRGKGVKEAVWSTAVQYGANTDVIQKALKGKNTASMSDAEMISAIQGYKEENVTSHFRSSSPGVQKGVLDRIKKEKEILLASSPGVRMANQPPGVASSSSSMATGEGNYNIALTINAQTTDPQKIADAATAGIKKSIQELRNEHRNKVIRQRVQAPA